MTNNISLFFSMLNKYNLLAFTHLYIFGFTFKGNVYYVETSSEILPLILKLDSASRGYGYSLRFNPTKQQKLLLLSNGARLLCSAEYFNTVVEESKYNRGEVFEKMITEMNGQVWKKDNVDFWEDGDLTVNGKSYQIKFEKATFTNEKALARL